MEGEGSESEQRAQMRKNHQKCMTGQCDTSFPTFLRFALEKFQGLLKGKAL